VISILAPIFGLIAFGAIIARANWLGANAVDVLNRFVVLLALPAELFQITLDVPLIQLDHPDFASAFDPRLALPFTLGWIICWRRQKADPQRLSAAAIEGLCVGYANTSFIGIPVCFNVFGVQSMAAITLTACALFALAIFMIETDRQREGRRVTVALKGMRTFSGNPLVFRTFRGNCTQCQRAFASSVRHDVRDAAGRDRQPLRAADHRHVSLEYPTWNDGAVCSGLAPEADKTAVAANRNAGSHGQGFFDATSLGA